MLVAELASQNRIKEQQFLFFDRTQLPRMVPNQYRLPFSGLAYLLLERLCRRYLLGTAFAQGVRLASPGQYPG